MTYAQNLEIIFVITRGLSENIGENSDGGGGGVCTFFDLYVHRLNKMMKQSKQHHANVF